MQTRHNYILLTYFFMSYAIQCAFPIRIDRTYRRILFPTPLNSIHSRMKKCKKYAGMWYIRFGRRLPSWECERDRKKDFSFITEHTWLHSSKNVQLNCYMGVLESSKSGFHSYWKFIKLIWSFRLELEFSFFCAKQLCPFPKLSIFNRLYSRSDVIARCVHKVGTAATATATEA